MQTTGYHGKQACSCPPSKDHSARAEAKCRLNLTPEAMHLLVCCPNCEGSMLADIIAMIYVGDDHDSEISVICGDNRTLLRQLEKELGHIETIHLYDTPSELSLLIDSTDLLLSEPHEIIAAEAAKHRLPLVLLRRDNRLPPASFRELFAKGCAIVAWDDVKIAEICIELLADEVRRTKMANAYSTE